MRERPNQTRGPGSGLQAEYRVQASILLGAAAVVITLAAGLVAAFVWWCRH